MKKNAPNKYLSETKVNIFYLCSPLSPAIVRFDQTKFKENMKDKTKRIIRWVLFAVIIILLLIIIKNWDGFTDGFNSGNIVG